MKKIYSLNKYSSRILILQSKKILPNRVFLCRFIFLFFLFLSIKSYAQESSISGLENIHISLGTTIVTEKSKIEMMVITSSSIKIYTKKADKEIEQKKEFIKSKIVNNNKEKITKRIREKLEKKIIESSKKTVIYSKNSNSNTSFEITNSILKQCTASQNNYDDSFINSLNDWLAHLYYYQNRDHVLYIFYHSKKAEDTLFARPPPYLC